MSSDTAEDKTPTANAVAVAVASTSTAAPKESVKLHPWIRPKPLLVQHDARLKILNSLTREKEHFLTIDGSSHVTWYMYV